MREPSPKLIQRDSMGCETMCIAQLLYMHGKIELSDVSKIDGRIGRKPGEADLKVGGLRLLFEAGFHVVEVEHIDPRKLIASPDYTSQVWAEMGYSPGQIKRALRDLYPMLRDRGLRKLALIERYSSQFTRRLERATPDDLHAMAAKDWQVGCLLPHDSGYSHDVLVVRPRGGKYQVYDPARGVSRVGKDRFARRVRPGYIGYHLPK